MPAPTSIFSPPETPLVKLVKLVLERRVEAVAQRLKDSPQVIAYLTNLDQFVAEGAEGPPIDVIEARLQALEEAMLAAAEALEVER